MWCSGEDVEEEEVERTVDRCEEGSRERSLKSRAASFDKGKQERKQLSAFNYNHGVLLRRSASLRGRNR